MKVYLTPYKNAPPFEDYILLSPKNPLALENEGIDNGELDALFIDGILSRLPPQHVPSGLDSLLKKVKLGGTLIIRDLDITEVARRHTYKTLDLNNLNNVVNQRVSFLNREVILDLLRELKVNVNRADFIETDFVIRGTR